MMNRQILYCLLVLISIATSLENENCSQQSFATYLQSYTMKCGEQCEEYEK